MRWYEIHTENKEIFKIQCDEITFKDDFLRTTAQEPLCLFQGKMLVAIFKQWTQVVDVTEKQSLIH